MDKANQETAEEAAVAAAENLVGGMVAYDLVIKELLQVAQAPVTQWQ
jgi:hypothetical protein